MKSDKLPQEKYNRRAYIISILAIAISLLAVFFPTIKEKYIDSPVIYYFTSNYLTLSQFYGNPSLMLPITFVNSGKRSSLLKKIDIELYNASNEIILKGKKGEIGSSPRAGSGVTNNNGPNDEPIKSFRSLTKYPADALHALR